MKWKRWVNFGLIRTFREAMPVRRKTYRELEADNAVLRAALRTAHGELAKHRLAMQQILASRYECIRMIEEVLRK